MRACMTNAVRQDNTHENYDSVRTIDGLAADNGAEVVFLTFLTFLQSDRLTYKQVRDCKRK